MEKCMEINAQLLLLYSSKHIRFNNFPRYVLQTNTKSFFKNVQYMELMLVFKTSCTLNSLNFYNNMYGQRHAVQKESNLILCVNLFNTRDRLTAQTELKTLIVQRIYAQENLYVFRSYVVLIHGLLVRHQFLVFKNLLTFLSESFILNI